MSYKLTDIVYNLIKDSNLYNYDNDKDLKDIDITTYYDIESIKHIKIDLGFESYILTIE